MDVNERTGKRFRDAVRKARAAARSEGLEWKEAREVYQAVGLPGSHAAAKDAWLKVARNVAPEVLPTKSDRDWEAFFDALAKFLEKVIPLIQGMFANC